MKFAFNITDKCNCNCEYCYYTEGPFNTVDEIYQTIDFLNDELPKLKNEGIMKLSAREPTIADNFFDYCDRIKTKFIVNTNLLCSKDILERLATYKNLHHLMVSYHHHKCENPVEFLEKIKFLKERGVSVTTNVMAENKDVDSIIKIYQKLKELGTVSHTNPLIEKIKDYYTDEILQKYVQAGMIDDKVSNLYKENKTRQVLKCDNQKEGNAIITNLKIYYCIFDKFPVSYIGDKNFVEIFNKPRYMCKYGELCGYRRHYIEKKF